MAAKNVRIVKMQFKPRAKGSAAAIRAAQTEIAAEMNTAIHRGLDRPNPFPHKNPSAAGTKPKLRTGFLFDKTQVVRKGNEIHVRTTQYGIYLEGGTRKMRPRPFIRRVIHAKKVEWSKKLTKAIKRHEKRLAS